MAYMDLQRGNKDQFKINKSHLRDSWALSRDNSEIGYLTYSLITENKGHVCVHSYLFINKVLIEFINFDHPVLTILVHFAPPKKLKTLPACELWRKTKG